jgi:hypothetical protein
MSGLSLQPNAVQGLAKSIGHLGRLGHSIHYTRARAREGVGTKCPKCPKCPMGPSVDEAQRSISRTSRNRPIVRPSPKP